MPAPSLPCPTPTPCGIDTASTVPGRASSGRLAAASGRWPLAPGLLLGLVLVSATPAWGDERFEPEVRAWPAASFDPEETADAPRAEGPLVPDTGPASEDEDPPRAQAVPQGDSPGSAVYLPFAGLPQPADRVEHAARTWAPGRRPEADAGLDYTLVSMALAALAFGAAWFRLHRH